MIVQEIIEVLRISSGGLAILLVEQNLRTALAVADRHHVMNKGEICFTGSSAELEEQRRGAARVFERLVFNRYACRAPPPRRGANSRRASIRVGAMIGDELRPMPWR
jgi:ABC-type multidrug transport system ATPase subunit